MTTKNWQEEITPELLQFATESQAAKLVAVRDCGTVKSASEKLGVSERVISRTLRVVRDKAARQGYAPKHDMRVTVPDGFHIRGTSTLYKDGQQALQWVKTSIDHERQAEMMREMIEAMAEDLPAFNPVREPASTNTGELSVYPVSDLHIGMLADADECGEDWDIKIADRVITKHFGIVVNKAPNSEQCLIAILGDFWHRFNIDGVSRSGHIFDCDSRFGKMHKAGVRIMMFMINACLQKHQRVHMIIASGNHDHELAAAARDWLGVVFADNPRFSIAGHDKPFYYHRFGKCLIGVTHGDKCKMDRLPGVMAVDMAKDWGDTEHRHWLTGHIHQNSAIEAAGVMCESFNVMCPKDAYANSGGWRSNRATTCMVFDAEDGLIERKYVLVRQ